MKTTIKLQLAILVLLLCGMSMAALGILIMRHEKQVLTDARDKRGKSLTRHLTATATEALLSGNKTKIFSSCTELVKNTPEVTQALLLDTNSIVYAHNNTALIGKACTGEHCRALQESETFRITSFTVNNKVFVEYAMPLITDTRVGSVRIIMTNSMISQALRQVLIQIVAVSCLLLMVILAVVLLFTHLVITIPMRKLSEGLQTSSLGNFNRRITVKDGNEFGTLLTLYNRMNSSLYKQKKDLFSLYNTVQTLDTNREMDALFSQSTSVINDFIGPRLCVISLFENNNLVVSRVSGREGADALCGSILMLPNEVFTKTFQQKTTQKFVAGTLKDMFTSMHIPCEIPGEEVLISPLVYGKKSKGLVILIGKNSQEIFSESDSKFLDIIALATAMSLFNIELIKKSQKKKSTEPDSVIAELARKVLMPQKPFTMKGIEICSYYRPAGDTYGNWHGFIEDKENNRLSVFIGDASGQGTHAALAASTASSFIKTMSMLKRQKNILALIIDKKPTIPIDQKELPLSMKPSFLLTLLNQILYSNVFGKQTMTFFATTFDLNKKKIYFANAGHEIPVFIKKKDSLPAALTSSGARLGDNEEAHYDQHTLDVEPGDVIVWYTIGVTRCQNALQESYGNMQLLRKIREASSLSAQELCKRLVEDIHAFRSNAPLIDDITLVTGRIL